MDSGIKKILKIVLIILATIAILFFAFCAWFIYESEFKTTVIFSEKYAEAPYELIVSELGSSFIFSPSNVEVKLKRNDRTIYKKKIEVSNDGKALTKEMNFKVEWQDEKLILTVMGEEQEDEIIEVELKDR